MPNVAIPGNAPVEAFGNTVQAIGQSRDIQAAGAAVERASDTTANIAIDIMARQAEADAKTADTQLADATRETLFDPQKGYFALRGKAAVDNGKSTLDGLKSLKDEISGTLSVNARRLFDASAKQRMEQAQDHVARHMMTEQKSYAENASNARISMAINDAGANYRDKDLVEKNMSIARSEVLAQAEEHKWGDDVTRLKLAEADSAAITAVVRRWMDEDPYRAKAIRDANAGKISNKDALALDPQIKEALTRRKAQDNATTIRDGVVLGDGRVENNIGNIVKSQFTYAGGKGAPRGAFETFQTPEHGVAAAYITIQAKANQNGGAISFLDLIGGNKKVKGWAPADDGTDVMLKGNDPASYAARLAKSVGLKPGDAIPLDDDGKMATILAEMNRHEKGKQTVPDGSFSSGIVLAKSGDKGAGDQPKPDIDPKTGRPTLGWQLDQAAKISDPDVREATQARIRSLHGQDEATLGEARRRAGEDVMGLILANRLTEVGQVPVEKWSALDESQKRTFMSLLDHNARGKDNPPNPTLYAELSRQMVDDPEGFKRRDLVPLATQLPNAHWTHFQNLQVAMGRAQNAEEEKRASIGKGLQISDALLRSAGVYLGYLDRKGKVLKAEEFNDFKAQYQSALLQELEQFQKDNKRRPTDDEMNKMADRMLMQGRFRDTGVFSDDRGVFFQQRQGEGAPQFYVRYGEIPVDRRKVVEDQLKARGLPSDKQAVERAYTAWRAAGSK
ncbi:hypothetical protein [uncultured Reyranella sp.]|uniref:hypothetical protein n=1 Tax=uncultured Reyranella sp. TaxID=735512 RepID=UPI00259D0B7D|nr:hypothetical protein [uncultured Reyranella sp.]